MADVFDSLLNKTATILKPDPAGTADDCGNISSLVTVTNNWPCRISTLGSRGKETKVEKEVSVTRWVAYMRPTTIDEHYTLRVDGIDYNVLEVLNPSMADHHYEVMLERVKA